MITVFFTCHACGLTEAKAFVRDRIKNETIKSWVNEAGRAVGLAHSLLSPRCEENKVDLKLPAGGEKGIGFPI